MSIIVCRCRGCPARRRWARRWARRRCRSASGEPPPSSDASPRALPHARTFSTAIFFKHFFVCKKIPLSRPPHVSISELLFFYLTVPATKYRWFFLNKLLFYLLPYLYTFLYNEIIEQFLQIEHLYYFYKNYKLLTIVLKISSKQT